MNSIAMPCSVFKLTQQFEDLRLHGDVERRRRLVGNQQFGPVGQRHGDHHALPLPARKLVRIGGSRFRGSRMPTWSSSSRTWCRACRADLPCRCRISRNLLLDRLQRIERGHRLLEDHGDVVAAHLADLGSGAERRSWPLNRISPRDGWPPGRAAI
jgi:hypothetical protein